MIIEKILNNNAVITFDKGNNEIIVMGKGIAYGKKTGEKINDAKISKIFTVNQSSKNKFSQLFENIPAEYLELSQSIISRAKCKLNIELDDTIYITLTDHIHTAVQRYQEGLYLTNKLLWEIKHFYIEEYEIGLEALHMIEAMFGVKMIEDEAGFIAMHLVTSEVGEDINDFYELTTFMHEALNIVKYYFKIEYDIHSLIYSRFITHLRFFGYRVLSTNKGNDSNIKNDILEIIKEKYIDSYLCALKVKQFIEYKYNYLLCDDEILYLTIHISKIKHSE